MFRLFSRTKSDSQRRSRRRRFLPQLESLETRTLLATYNWTAGVDGTFGTASAWTNSVNASDHQVPGPTDNASIPGGITVTVGGSQTVNSVSGTLNITAGTFSVANAVASSSLNSLQLASGATLQTTGGQTAIFGSDISGTLNATGTGTIRFERQQNNLNSGAAMTGSGQFLVQGDVGGGPTVSLLTNVTAPQNFQLANGILNGSGNLTIGGTFEWMGDGNGTTMSGTGITIVQSGATLHIGSATGGATLNQRTLENHGTINYDAPGEFAVSGSATIKNLVGATFNLLVNQKINGRVGGNLTGSLNNDGLFVKKGAAGLSTLDMFVNNTGTVQVQAGQLVTRFGQSTGGTFLTAANTTFGLLGGGTRTWEGNVSLQGSGIFNLDAGDQAVSLLGATVTVASTAQLNWNAGTITIPQNVSLEIIGKLTQNASAGDVTLRGGGTLKMSGELLHTGTSNIVISGDTGTNQIPTKLNIPATRFYTVTSDAGLLEAGAGGIIINAGTMRKNAGTGTSVIAPAVQNTGRLSSNTGTLSFREVTTTGGELSSTAGATLQLTDQGSSTFTQSGTVTGLGTGLVKVGPGTLIANGTTTTVVPAAVSFLWDAGNITVANILNINGNFDLAPTGQIGLGGAGKLRVNGEIKDAGPGQLVLQGAGATPTTLEIPATRQFTFLADGSIGQTGAGGTVVNLGEIRKTGGTGTSSITSALDSSAVINSATGTLVLAPASGTMNGGTLNAATGAILDLTGGTTVDYQGTFTGSGGGEVRLQSGTINVIGGVGGCIFNLSGSTFRMSGGSFATNGIDVTLSGSSKITGAAGVDIAGGGTFHVKGTLSHGGNGSLRVGGNTNLSIDAGANYNITADGDLAVATGGSFLEIFGTLRKSGGSGLTTIGIPASNQGLVEVKRGTMQFTGGVNQIIGDTLTGGGWQLISTGTTSATLDLNTDLLVIGLQATVTLNGPNCNFASIFNVDNIAGKFNLFGGANFLTAESVLNSGQITVGATSLLDVSGQYSQTSTGKVTFNGSGSKLGKIRTLTGAVLAGQLAVSWSGALPAINTVFTIFDNQGANPVSGTFQNKAQNATFTVSGMTFRISYTGGTGNDVTLTRIA